jgi:hypothetical protein
MPLIIGEKTTGLPIISPLVLVCHGFLVFPVIIYFGSLSETGKTVPFLIGATALFAAALSASTDSSRGLL